MYSRPKSPRRQHEGKSSGGGITSYDFLSHGSEQSSYARQPSAPRTGDAHAEHMKALEQARIEAFKERKELERKYKHGGGDTAGFPEERAPVGSDLSPKERIMERKRQQQADHEIELAKAREEAQRERLALERKYRGADSGRNEFSPSDPLHTKEPRQSMVPGGNPFQPAPPQQSPGAAPPPPPPPLPGGLQRNTPGTIRSQEREHPLSRNTKSSNACSRCGQACSGFTGGVSWQGKLFHAECFTCVYCNAALARRAKITERTDEATVMTPAAASSEGEPCCIACEEEHRVLTCIHCHEVIPKGQQTGFQGRGPYCMHCAANERGLNCTVCKQLIVEAKWTTDAQGRVYHDQCFACTKCQSSLVGMKYYDEPTGLHCEECFARDICSKCPTCNAPVLEDGTRWCDMTFHKGCFICCICKKGIDEYGRREMYLGGNGMPTCRYCFDDNPVTKTPIRSRTPTVQWVLDGTPPSAQTTAVGIARSPIDTANSEPQMETFINRLLSTPPQAPASSNATAVPSEQVARTPLARVARLEAAMNMHEQTGGAIQRLSHIETELLGCAQQGPVPNRLRHLEHQMGIDM